MDTLEQKMKTYTHFNILNKDCAYKPKFAHSVCAFKHFL